MKEHPILYSTEMVKAILAGNKTQTRRVMNPQPLQAHINSVPTNGWDSVIPMNPYGMPGDILWVRETFFDCDKFRSAPIFQRCPRWIFKTDGVDIGDHKWKPSIHMPKAAARIWLQIESITVERLQDISEEDAIAEGAEQIEKGFDWLEAKFGFQILWDSINGKRAVNPKTGWAPAPMDWNANPWVWVIKFKVLSTTGNPHYKGGKGGVKSTSL